MNHDFELRTIPVQTGTNKWQEPMLIALHASELSLILNVPHRRRHHRCRRRSPIITF